MNGVWQSHCSTQETLEPPRTLAIRSHHSVRNEHLAQPDPAVCPSGSGTRLQSELRGFDSRHGLNCLDQDERRGGTLARVPPRRAVVSVPVSVGPASRACRSFAFYMPHSRSAHSRLPPPPSDRRSPERESRSQSGEVRQPRPQMEEGHSTRHGCGRPGRNDGPEGLTQCWPRPPCKHAQDAS
jgi:hypothetical protein